MAQSDRAPAFQFYPKDFLSDPNVMQMTNAQVGAYWKLVSICWMQDRLPDDETALSRLVGESIEWWAENGALIRACFRVRSGHLIHPRLQNEKQKQKKRRRGAQKGAEKTNAKRYQKQEDSSLSEDRASAESRSSSSSSSPSSSPTPVTVPNGTVREGPTHSGAKSCFVPEDWEPEPILPGQCRIAPGVDVDQELAQFRLHEFAQPKSNWQAAWLKWLTNAKPKPHRAVGDDDALSRWANGEAD